METRPTSGTLASESKRRGASEENLTGLGNHGHQANHGHTSRIRRILRGRSGACSQGAFSQKNTRSQANSGHTSSYCVASLWHFFRGEVMEAQVGNHRNAAPVCMPVRFSRIRLSQVSQGLEPQRNRANTVGQFANYEILRGRAWAPGITETRPTAGTLAESGEYCADALAAAQWPTPWGSLRTLLPGQPRAQ